MMVKCFIIALFALLSVLDGQLADNFPELTKVTLGVVEGLVKSPIATLAQTSGDAVSAAARALVFLPEAATHAIGVGIQPGILPDSHSNLAFGELDSFLPDYKAGEDNEDARLDIRDLIRKYGYPLEEHEVTTEDDYVLTLFRIPGNGSAVFLMHGLLGSADDFVIAGPESGLAYLLSIEGYDVWLGNARGNKHSRRHVNLKPTLAKFWDFSWHEIGIYDLPAMIDVVLNETDGKPVKYIGHSQGTTSFFVMASERPEYNEKITLMVALSPVAYMSNVRSPVVRLLAPGTPFIHGFVKTVGLYEFLPENNLMRTLKLLLCSTGVITNIVCSNVMFLMAGVGYAQFNFTNLPVLMGHMPSGASAKQVAHYGQGVLTGEFRKFDYGQAGNIEKYGRETPPSYALNNISVPISLFYSESDWLAHPKDVDKLYNQLDSAIDIHKIPYKQFNHLDFLFAKDVKTLVYKRLVKLLTFY